MNMNHIIIILICVFLAIGFKVFNFKQYCPECKSIQDVSFIDFEYVECIKCDSIWPRHKPSSHKCVLCKRYMSLVDVNTNSESYHCMHCGITKIGMTGR